jgi:mannan endo-1,4-beta-mannosidase
MTSRIVVLGFGVGAWVFGGPVELAVPAAESVREEIRLLAADARLDGCERGVAGEGEKGVAVLTGFDTPTDRARWPLESAGGIYRIEVAARGPGGPKRFLGRVGGQAFSGVIPAGGEIAARSHGWVELAAGSHELEIGGAWGHYDIAAVALVPAEVAPPPCPGPGRPVNPEATPAARALLRMVVDSYGKRTLSGQMEEADLAVLAAAGADAPALFAADLMYFSPSMAERQPPPQELPEAVLRMAETGHVISLLWHWNAPDGLVDDGDFPWWRGFYTAGSTFDVAAALADPAGASHALLMRDIDAIAAELRKFADAGVPVLWRPLHEADGAWFWWGAHGPEPFKQLWRLLYHRFTHHHRLNHLLWCVTIEDPSWHPGDDVVDVVCVDVYPEDRGDLLTGVWSGLRAAFDGRKPIALGEFPGVPDIPKMRRMGVHWAWFCSWREPHGPRLNSADEIRRVFESPEVITLRDLPAQGR